MSKPAWREAVDEAVRRKGSLTAVARALGITRTAVYAWPKEGPPAKHVLSLEAMSGVSRYLIRPDLFGEDPRGSHHAA